MGLTAIDKMKINLACYQSQIQSTLSYNPTPSFYPNCSTWTDPTLYNQNHIQSTQFFHGPYDSSYTQEQAQMAQRFSTPSYDSSWVGQHNNSGDSYQGLPQNPLDQFFQNWAPSSNSFHDQTHYGKQPTSSPLPHYSTSCPTNSTSQSTPLCPTLNQEESFDEFCQYIMSQNQAFQMRMDKMNEKIKRAGEYQLLDDSRSIFTEQIPNVHHDQSIISQDHNTQICINEGIMERSCQETLEGVSYTYHNDKTSEFEELEYSREINDLKLRGGEEVNDVQGQDQNPPLFFPESDEILLENEEEDEVLKQELNIYLNDAIGINEELNLLNDNFDTCKERVEIVPIHDHSDSSNTVLTYWSDFALHLTELADPIESCNPFEETLFQEQDKEDAGVENELSEVINNISWEKEEVETLHDLHWQSSEQGEDMDFLSIPDMANSHVEVHTFMLADLSDSIEPSKLYGVEEYASFTMDSPYLLDTNSLIKNPHPLIYSHLMNIHVNPKIEVVEKLLNNNKVCIYVFNTYKDLKFEEKYSIMDDIIIPLSFLTRVVCLAY